MRSRARSLSFGQVLKKGQEEMCLGSARFSLLTMKRILVWLSQLESSVLYTGIK